MQRLNSLLLLFVVVTSLVACGSSGEVYVGVPAPTPIPAPTPAEPHLDAFHVIDSYGYSSEYSPVYESVLDPAVNDGLFEIYWYAESFYDYWVTVAINDRPSMAGSIILSEELCGYGLSCDYDGMQICEYTFGPSMGCGADLYEAHRNLTSIEPLLQYLPEYLYLNIEVCDESGWACEVLSREVTVY